MIELNVTERDLADWGFRLLNSEIGNDLIPIYFYLVLYFSVFVSLTRR